MDRMVDAGGIHADVRAAFADIFLADAAASSPSSPSVLRTGRDLGEMANGRRLGRDAGEGGGPRRAADVHGADDAASSPSSPAVLRTGRDLGETANGRRLGRDSVEGGGPRRAADAYGVDAASAGRSRARAARTRRARDAPGGEHRAGRLQRGGGRHGVRRDRPATDQGTGAGGPCRAARRRAAARARRSSVGQAEGRAPRAGAAGYARALKGPKRDIRAREAGPRQAERGGPGPRLDRGRGALGWARAEGAAPSRSEARRGGKGPPLHPGSSRVRVHVHERDFMPATFRGFVLRTVTPIRGSPSSVGGFAAFRRRAAPACPLTAGGASDLFPLPHDDGAVAGGARARRSAGQRPPRARGRELARRAEDAYTALTIDWLNFEAGGRQVSSGGALPRSAHAQRKTPPTPSPAADVERAVARARSHVRLSVRSMLRAAAGVPLADLARGRGKVRDAWGVVDGLQEYAARLAATFGRTYRTSEVLGAECVPQECGAEEVDGRRVALPTRGAVLDIADLLEGCGLRGGFETPAKLQLAPDEHAPFAGRRCDRLPREERAGFARRLDDAGMLFVAGADSGHAGGLFAVRKGWDEDKGWWSQRLVLDRRPRNAEEELVGKEVLGESMPHGSVWCETVLPPDRRLVLWATDLPSFYYACRVTAARARSNQFTKLVSLKGLEDLSAVQAYHARLASGEEVGNPAVGALCLNTLAMGDLNATGYAQGAHRELLRRASALPAEVAYYAPYPIDDVVGGVMIDDFVVAAQVPLADDGDSPCRPRERARACFDRARRAYAAAGVPDVEKKRVVESDSAVVWGCEVRGREGRAGSALAKRAALAALTGVIAAGGVACGPLLATVQGMWVDMLLYRRPVLALLAALPQFVQEHGTDARPRTLPGTVVSELWGLVAVAPLLETNLRAPVAASLQACDASLEGGGACVADLPADAARELWRFRGRPGAAPVLGARGLCFGGEIAEALPWRATRMWRWQRRARAGINLCEGRARRLLLRSLAALPEHHGSRQCVLYDSTVTSAGAAQGRSAAVGLRAEQRRAYPALLAADLQEGVVWADSERNPADHPSRGSRRMPVPAPARAWVAEWLWGSTAALPERINELEGLGAATDPEWPDWSAGEHWRDVRWNNRAARAVDRAGHQPERRARLRAALNDLATPRALGHGGPGGPRQTHGRER